VPGSVAGNSQIELALSDTALLCPASEQMTLGSVSANSQIELALSDTALPGPASELVKQGYA